MAIESGVSIKDFGRIGIFMGGISTEREISLKSGQAVYESLKQINADVELIDIVSDNVETNINLIRSHNINCAFLALHGHFGEDGQIQEILDKLNIPYTGSGVLASKLAMDKIASRRVLAVYNLPVPKYKAVEKNFYNDNWQSKHSFSFPLVIKPAAHGSSIGLSIIDKEEEFKQAMDAAFAFDERVILEEYIFGREMTVGILDNQPLPVVEIIPKKRFFDYEAKYKSGMTDYRIPADLEEEIAEKIQTVAIQAHKLLGCSGCSRVDLILNEANIPFILELNSIPGLTPMSLLPKAARQSGIEFTQLCVKLIELAYEKAKAQISAG